jgi:flagellar hook-associated protein 1 FlgK
MAGNPLDSALSGLRIAQQQLTLISTNIANVQTPGYTRKILPQSVRAIGGEAVGVLGDAVIRKVDMFLTRDLWTQISTVGSAETSLRYLSQVENFHGSPDSQTNIAAKIAALKDKFTTLSDSPIDTFAQNAVIAQAQDVASKINDFSRTLTQLRNNAESEISTTIDRINDLLGQVAQQNQEIQAAQAQGRTTATYADLRDSAVSELAQLIDVDFFVRGDGVMVIQTKTGVQLADQLPTEIYFAASTLGPDKYYPASINGIYLGGNPADNPNSVDITEYDLGGKLGALVDLRDTEFPSYQAQLDETAYRMAQRFDALGLRLFTDENGLLPADTAPVPNPPGPLTPVAYVGFSSNIQVNPNIIDDPSLIQSGTMGDTIQTGSNEVIRRVLNFAFEAIEYQAIEGSRDIRVSANPLGDTLQENFGLWSQNTILGSLNLAQYTGDITAAAGNPFGATSDDFTIRVYDSRAGFDSGVTTIDLSLAAAAYPIGSVGVGTGIGTVDNAAEQLASFINATAWPADADLEATVNIYGQLVINTRGNVTIGAGTMGTTGLDFLGLAAGTTTTVDPYFDVVVGNNPPTRITIEPGETETDLIAKIDAVPGIDTADIVLSAGGFLSFRPQRGGDIRLIGGPFTSDAAGFSTAGGIGIVEEIFGSADPRVDYAHAAFRTTNLGPGVNLGSSIPSATSIIDYGQKMINTQIQDKIALQNTRDDEEQYRATLEKQLLDESGVNIDEELANMISIQSAYAAAARAISTAEEMFRELLDSV